MRRHTRAPPTKTLTDRQKYLLNRIPGKYDMNGYHRAPEPAEVKKARALVDRWEKVQAKEKCRADKRAEALRRKAQEAVYFDADVKALAIVRQCEKLLKGCED